VPVKEPRLTARERTYVEGQRSAWAEMLRAGLRQLGYMTEGEPIEVVAARLATQLEETRQALRSVCKAYGDNRWTDDLHLADVVEKHLGRPLDDELGRR